MAEERAAESQRGAVYVEHVAGAEWVSSGGLARLAGLSTARLSQLKAAGKLPEPDSLMDDGRGRAIPIWEMATARAWVESR